MALATPPGAENPSPAFLTGQAHGAALAVQHHAAAAKPAAAPKPSTAAGGGSTLDELLAQAQGIAQQETNQQVAAIRAQQALYNSQAQTKAQQEIAASQAAAQLIAGLGLGDQTAASYGTAAQQLAGLAQGFSGQTQTDATNAANTVQQQLAGLGAPAGSLKTATGQTSNPAALGNTLYGLGGFIPGNVLETVGQAQAGGQRELPLSALSYGQQQAAGELAAGQQNADSLTQNIINARSQEPSLYQSILSSLNSTLTNQALANSLIGDRNATTLGKQGLSPSGSPLPGYQTNPVTGGVSKVPPGYTINGSGQVVKIPTTALAKPPSAATLKSWNSLSDTNRNGKVLSRVVKDPTTGQESAQQFVVAGTQKTYQQNIADLVANGAPRAKAIQIANSDYAPGELGRPYSAAQQQTLAKTAATKIVNGETNPATGKPYTTTDAVAAAAKVGIPAKTVTAAVRAATRAQAASRAAALRASGGAPIRWNGRAWVPAK